MQDKILFLSVFEHQRVMKAIIDIFSFFSDTGKKNWDIKITGDFDIEIFVFPFVMLGKFSLMALEDLATPRYQY